MGEQSYEGVKGRSLDQGLYPGPWHQEDQQEETPDSAAQTPGGQLHTKTGQVQVGDVQGGVVGAPVLRDQYESGGR